MISLRHALLWLRTTHGNPKVDRSLAFVVAIQDFDRFKVFRIVVIEIGPNAVFPEINLIRTANVDTFEAPDFTECGKTRPVFVRNVHTHVPQLLANLKQAKGTFCTWSILWPVKRDRRDLLTTCVPDPRRNVKRYRCHQSQDNSCWKRHGKIRDRAVDRPSGSRIDYMTPPEEEDVDNRTKGPSG